MAIGFIIGALSVTGLAGTLANDLVYLAGGAPLVLLLMGALVSFIFGMGMTVTACYIFLAIVLAPPLIKAGLDPLAVHLFVMYWGMVSFITPPVALATFAAAPLAGVSAMRIGVQSVRLGTAIYLVPFAFVLNPALLLKGDPATVILNVSLAFIGIVIIASALQGYVLGIGNIARHAGRLAGARGYGLRRFPAGGALASPYRFASFGQYRDRVYTLPGWPAFDFCFRAHSSKKREDSAMRWSVTRRAALLAAATFALPASALLK